MKEDINIFDIKTFLQNNPNINYMDLYKNGEFTKLLTDEFELQYIMKNFPIRLVGDIRKIIFYGRNHAEIIATINNKPELLGTYEAKIIIPDNMKDKICDILTDTGFEFKVFFINQYNFVLNEIISKNNLLNSPYCICSGNNPDPNAYASLCHKVLGYSTSSYSDYCPLCGSNTEMVYDVYKGKYENFFKNDLTNSI